MNLRQDGKAKFSAEMYPLGMSDCEITEAFIAAVSGQPEWWKDERQHYCAYCGVKPKPGSTGKGKRVPDEITHDHIIPQSRQGRLTIPACHQCNKEKASRSMEEFLGSRRFRKMREKPNNRQWPVEALWLAQSAAAIQICFRAKERVVPSASQAKPKVAVPKPGITTGIGTPATIQ